MNSTSKIILIALFAAAFAWLLFPKDNSDALVTGNTAIFNSEKTVVIHKIQEVENAVLLYERETPDNLNDVKASTPLKNTKLSNEWTWQKIKLFYKKRDGSCTSPKEMKELNQKFGTDNIWINCSRRMRHFGVTYIVSLNFEQKSKKTSEINITFFIKSGISGF